MLCLNSFKIVSSNLDMNYTEVMCGLWVSDVKLLQNRDFMIDNQISIILNCTQYYDFPSVEAQKIRLPFFLVIHPQLLRP